MPQASLPSRPAWWNIHQQALQLRDLDALQRVRTYLLPDTLAWRRLEREQAAIEVAIAALRCSARGER